MTVHSSRFPTLRWPRVLPARTVPGRRPASGRLGVLLAGHRGLLTSYAQLLAGSGGRLALQVVYFFVLANTLSLAEMGVFASVSGAGMLIGCFAGFGFQSYVMRAAAGRRASLSGYLAAYYLCAVLALPLLFAVAGLVYLVLFRNVIELPAYLAIMLVEIVLWRQIELLVQVNNGLGRFAAASTLVSLPVGFRAVAAVAFWAGGGGHAETWSLYYLAGNLAAAVALSIAFHPRIRLRHRTALLKGRLRDGLLFAFSYLLFTAQTEVDKLVILTLAGERMAGIYAISMRLIDLTGVPLRPIFMMYSRELIRARRASWERIRQCLKLEGTVALVSTGMLLALLAMLHLRPGILGPNVSAAYGMLAAIIAVPAVRNLLEFHGELFFAFGSMTLRAGLTASFVLLKALAVALILLAAPGSESWGVWLNAVYLAIYAISFTVVYRLLVRSAAS
ncbi:hypothetical protein MMB17_10135 [Methylobacterium organophilum]|uniref:lipopolysaccharide biosynthesis protein n=1 Tax=Methylobacterium organophilum TaxID=410 RepID=UPI001F13D129|nr:hypothetical protein [Methylobacterium organophilum]UMY19624.1 hypothetical protein MMB17_10135 [Methylobacterium organophilum]